MNDFDELESSIHDLDHAPELPDDHSAHRIRGRSYSTGNVGVHPLEATGRPRLWSSGNAAASPLAASYPPASGKQRRFSASRILAETSNRKRADHTRSRSSSQIPSPTSSQLHAMDFIEEAEEGLDYPSQLRVRSKSADVETRSSRLPASPTSSFLSEPSLHHAVEEGDSVVDSRSEKSDERQHPLEEESSEPIELLGFLTRHLSNLFPTNRCTWSGLARLVVTPIWCARYPQITERAVLQRLNILSGISAALQLTSALWLVLTLFAYGKEPEKIGPDQKQADGEGGSDVELLVNVWTVNGNVILIGFLALLVFSSAVMNIRVIRNVNLVGAIRYLWILLWVLPFMLFCVIGCFDYFRATQVWITHWWRDETLGKFREWFCVPSGTANTLCAAPIVPNVTQWCLEKYNTTRCEPIRERAQEDMERFMLAYYYLNAGWGLVMVLLLLLMVNTLENIITRPLVQKSRESNVPAWFSLPIIGCVFAGSLYAFSKTSVLSTSSGHSEAKWIGPLYIAAGGLFFLAAVLGWFISAYSILNTRDKRCKLISILLFIFVACTIIAILATIFAGAIALSLAYIDEPISEEDRGGIACAIDQANTCTCCSGCNVTAKYVCPQWTEDDVTRVLQTQAKQSATLAAIFILYALSALRFGLTMRKYIVLYQIEYV